MNMKKENFNAILIFILTIFLIFNYLSLSKKTSISQLIENMGFGYNFANTFENYDPEIRFTNPMDQITLNGNKIPTRKTIKNLKKYGFNTFRVPVTWANFIDEYGNIDSKWMSLIKEVVDAIVKNNAYCILNIYSDSDYGMWLDGETESIDIYINLWTQIAEEMKDYDEHLIFEAMDDTFFFDEINFDYDYETHGILNQCFIDTIRNSSNFNKERLLIISSINSEIGITRSENFIIPNDPYNKLALSLHYFRDFRFLTSTGTSDEYIKWGFEDNYNNLINDFEGLKGDFINKGIPVIISEFGVSTELNKEIDSIRLYIYSIFSLSKEYGFVACLRDTSNKEYGDMNYFNRDTNQWYDTKLADIISSISKGKNGKPSDYFITTNTKVKLNEKGENKLKIENYNLKPIKITVNALLKGRLYTVLENLQISAMFGQGISELGMVLFEYGINDIKKQYDGTIIVEAYNNIENIPTNFHYTSTIITINLGQINNVTIEFEKPCIYFNYLSFKSDFFNRYK